MSGALVWLLVALGLGVVVVRRRSLAVALVTVQALVLARHRGHARRRPAAAAVLAVRAVALGTLAAARRLAHARAAAGAGRHRTDRACRARGRLRARAHLARAVDRPRLAERRAGRARVDRVRHHRRGHAAARRSSRSWGSCSCENGLALAALELPGGSSTAIELGVAFDLTLVASSPRYSTRGSSPSSAQATPPRCGACVTSRELLALAVVAAPAARRRSPQRPRRAERVPRSRRVGARRCRPRPR